MHLWVKVNCWCPFFVLLIWKWFSTFLILWPFNTVSHVVVIPFATAMNNNVNIWYADFLGWPLWKGHLIPQRGCNPQVENHCLRLSGNYATAPLCARLRSAYFQGSWTLCCVSVFLFMVKLLLPWILLFPPWAEYLVPQASLRFTEMELRITWNFWSSCFSPWMLGLQM